ncbi:MAG: TetR/AcrR family transcriptional regulator [Pseudomonadota bacterium]
MARTIAKDHDAKRRQILSVAAQVFAQEGYDRASMNQVAATAGISKANIYHYYNGKEDLLYALLEEYLTELRSRVLAIPTTGTAPETRLRLTVQEILRAYQGADDTHRVLVAGLSPLPEARRTALQAIQRDMVRRLSSILAEVAPSLADDRARLRAATMSIFGMLNWHFMWNPGAGPEDRDSYASLVTDLTLGGVRHL